MAENERPTMVELEERFVKDKDKSELNKLLKELDGYLSAVKKELDRGLPPEEYRKLSRYRTALEQARDAALRGWAMTVKL